MAESNTVGLTGNKPIKEIFDDLINPIKKRSMLSKLWVRFLILVLLIGIFAYLRQLTTGLGVTAMRDYSTWGVYIANFVFLIAVSLVGSLVTAILKLTDMPWATPLSRIAEVVAVGALVFAGMSIIVDMGRPDRALNIFLHGRVSSPIVWDVTVVTTYMIISIILLYIPLIPDIAILRDRYTDAPKWQQKAYQMLSLGWKGTAEQYRLLRKAIKTMMVLMMPVALAIHTVTSWLFAVNNRTGWDSTIFGPYFVAGAFMVGSAAVIIGMYVFRKAYKLEYYLNKEHFNMMGKLLVLTSLVYLYFNINEYLVPAYKMKKLDAGHIDELFGGHEALLFWGTQVLGMIVPILLLLFKRMRTPGPLLIISIVVVMGAWLKRFILVVPTQFHPTFPIQNVPEHFTYYHPTFTEIAVTSGTIAGTLLIVTLFVRMFPILPIWEIAHENGHHNVEEAAKNEQ